MKFYNLIKKHIYILIFLISNICYSQSSGTITYLASFDASKIKHDIASKKFDSIPNKKEDLLKFISELQKIEYVLTFNKNESIYKKVEDMKVDDQKINITKILAGNDIIYTNTIKNTLIKLNNTYGELYLINKKLNSVKWNMVNETKKIGKYLCYKATTKVKFSNSNGVFYKKIIAWYTPEIPLAFGPVGYGNLPGIILELKEGKLIYKAIKINLKNKPLNIQPPKNGKKVTQEEFDKIGLEAMKMFQNN